MNKPEYQFQQQFQVQQTMSRKRTHSVTDLNTIKKPKNSINKITAQRTVPAFLNKLYSMVEDISTNDLIRWSKDNSSFIVEKHEEFAKTVLPRFYKHNTFASFVRQLNMYNFHKVPHIQQGVLVCDSEFELWEFSHPHFQRARPDLLVLVTRKNTKDKETLEEESTLGIASLVQEIDKIKSHQSVINDNVKDLHRDNEILWQETLSTREKYQNHQEAIQKMLQFLGAIFTSNNLESLPRGLIQEATYLTLNNSNQRADYMKQQKEEVKAQQQELIQEQKRCRQQNEEKEEQQKMVSPPDDPYQQPHFYQALNYAQTITQDMNSLQSDIESLANVMGINPQHYEDTMQTSYMTDPILQQQQQDLSYLYYPYIVPPYNKNGDI